MENSDNSEAALEKWLSVGNTDSKPNLYKRAAIFHLSICHLNEKILFALMKFFFVGNVKLFSGFLAFFPSGLEGGTGRIRFEAASLI